jgi:hypothetical protein
VEALHKPSPARYLDLGFRVYIYIYSREMMIIRDPIIDYSARSAFNCLFFFLVFTGKNGEWSRSNDSSLLIKSTSQPAAKIDKYSSVLGLYVFKMFFYLKIY